MPSRPELARSGYLPMLVTKMLPFGTCILKRTNTACVAHLNGQLVAEIETTYSKILIINE